MNKLKNHSMMFFVLMAVWLLLNGNTALQTVLAGAAVCLVLTAMFSSRSNLFAETKLTPKALIYMILYGFVFLKELVKSNIDVAGRVLLPSLPIKPGIVKVKTTLKSRTGRMVLANSITLTPGTFTVETAEEYLYIHWINVTAGDTDAATRAIVKKFEKYLEVIYG
jgi:multicomponent Na+:H+ antiporter subunit E